MVQLTSSLPPSLTGRLSKHTHTHTHTHNQPILGLAGNGGDLEGKPEGKGERMFQVNFLHSKTYFIRPLNLWAPPSIGHYLWPHKIHLLIPVSCVRWSRASELCKLCIQHATTVFTQSQPSAVVPPVTSTQGLLQKQDVKMQAHSSI